MRRRGNAVRARCGEREWNEVVRKIREFACEAKGYGFGFIFSG